MTDLKRIEQILSKADILTEQHTAVKELESRVSENEVIISVIGQFKRGKSSVINAILGENILPVGIIPLTTAVTEIRKGEKFKAEVCFGDGTSLEISQTEIEDYCSEQKNKGNHKNVETVKLYTPNHPFGDGVVLVDTPGVGSVNRHNTDSAYNYVQQSDAILFLLSVDSPVSETERDFLLNAKEYATKFFFAVNKCDEISKEDLKVFTDFCKDTISESMGSEIVLRPISAKTKDGIKELTESLKKELLASKSQILNRSIEKKVDILVSQAKTKLEVTLKAMSIPIDELNEKISRMEEKEQELTVFADELSVLAKHRTDLLVKDIRKYFDECATELKKDTDNKCDALYQANKNLSAKEFETKMQSEINLYMREKLTELNDKGIQMLEKGYESIVGILNGKADEAAQYISQIFKEEFGTEYPVSKSDFQVSERSDFLFHIGLESKFMMDLEFLSRLLSKNAENRRFYKRAKRQAINDVDRNLNNMISNYSYKMQESLRTLCRQLNDSIKAQIAELDSLTSHIHTNLNEADNIRQQQANFYTEIYNSLEGAKNGENQNQES